MEAVCMLSSLNQAVLDWLELYGAPASGIWYVYSFILGACFGSFTTACVWRVPRGISIVWPPSSCPKCGHKLGLWENIPILGWICLRGKCKGCGMPISPRYLIIELVTALLFTLSSFFALDRGVPLAILPAWMLIVLSVGSTCTDCELRIIPDKFTYTAMVLALLWSVLVPGRMAPLYSLAYTAAGIGAVGLFGASAVYGGKLLFKRDALGWGDVKYLMAAAGLTSVPGALFAVFAGSAFALIWLLFDAWRRGRLRRRFAFGPFLAAGAVTWLFAGTFLLEFCLKR